MQPCVFLSLSFNHYNSVFIRGTTKAWGWNTALSMSGTTPPRKTTPRKVPTWGEQRKTTQIGDAGGRTPRNRLRDNEPAAEYDESSAAAAYCSNTSRTVTLGSRTYVWPQRVVIIGYGVAKHGNRPPPAVTALFERLEKECDWGNRWEIRLQDQMKVSKPHDICTFFI